MCEILDLNFDKGNGAFFEVALHGRRIRCFVSQENAFLAKKASPGHTFPEVFERYKQLIGEAAELSILRNDISSGPWGKLITEHDIEAAQARRRKGQSILAK